VVILIIFLNKIEKFGNQNSKTNIFLSNTSAMFKGQNKYADDPLGDKPA